MYGRRRQNRKQLIRSSDQKTERGGGEERVANHDWGAVASSSVRPSESPGGGARSEPKTLAALVREAAVDRYISEERPDGPVPWSDVVRPVM
jgi:hypothetical protein